MMVIAIGDMDDNKHSDIVTLSDDQKILTVHFFNTERMDFKGSTSINLGDCLVTSATFITSTPYKLALICSENVDYDYIKVLKEISDGTSVESVDVTAHKLQKGGQPLFIDINSDSYTDFIYTSNTPIDSGDNIRVVYYNIYKAAFETNTLGLFDMYLVQDGSGGCKKLDNPSMYKLSVPHYSTLTDLNADCIADLYLTVTTTGSDLFGITMIFMTYTTKAEQYLMY